MLYSAIAMIALFALMALIPPFGNIFGIYPIGAFDWLVVVVLTLIPTLVAELSKRWTNRKEAKEYRNRIVVHKLDEEKWCR